MLTELSIPKKKTRVLALDHEALFTLGRKHIEQLAKRIWTDYNVHDPGITTLELLAYALTDLGYRASFPIEDLLASASDNATNMASQFFTARQILPNRPLTPFDYRRLLIDLPGVKNAWFSPAPHALWADTARGRLLRADPHQPNTEKVDVQGLYHVVIDFMDAITTAEDREQVITLVRERLYGNRNLCENFVSFGGVTTQEFLLCARIELTPQADTIEVMARIFHAVDEYLAPPVRNFTLSEMLARVKPDGQPYEIHEIFDGPVLDCGFIPDEELAAAELRTEIRLSDIISIIMDIEGVAAVRDIVINPKGAANPSESNWVIPVAPGKKPLLDRGRSAVSLFKRAMPVPPDKAKVEAHYQELREKQRVMLETPLPPEERDLPIPQGKYRNPDTYYSFQNHYPVIYGLSDIGLPSQVDDRRRALAHQFKAYLLFFDQVMADYLADLAHVRELFSLDPTLRRTYFHQVVASFTKWDEMYAAAKDGLTKEEKIAKVMAAFETDVETEADRLESIARRNRFLDHLIARFSERFTDYAHILRSAFGASDAHMIAMKCDFLASYPEVSSGRAVAYNMRLLEESALWNSTNVSGLEKRLAKLLGFHHARRNLADISYDLYAEVDATPDDEFRFRVLHRETGEILLSSSTRYLSHELARQEMREAIRFAMTPAGYERKTASDGTHYYNIISDQGEVIARRIKYFPTEAQMDQAIESLTSYLQIHYSEEGMYLVENILLLPEEPTDPLLPVCPAANATHDCARFDPYSYRIHVILPAYGSRFDNMDFRRYCEEVIRAEMPAHILPKICWISKDEMAIFEGQYRDWLAVRAGATTVDREGKLTRFAETLMSVRNVYPGERILACGPGDERKKFLLGGTALGTMPGEEDG